MRLKILLIAVLVSLIALPAFAAVQNVKIGGDLTMLGIMRNNFDLRNSAEDVIGGNLYADDRAYLASMIRIRLDADLTENVAATLRLINERDWSAESTTNTDIDLDLAYVTLKEFMSLPVTLTLGRQELWFGNALILGGAGSPTTTSSDFEAGDLELRDSLDAVRATFDLSEYAPVTVDAIFVKIDENTTFLNDDVNLYGINARYDFDDYDAIGEAYWFCKKAQSSETTIGHPAAVTGNSKAEYIHNAGLRGSAVPMEDLTVQLEGVYQFGDFTGAQFGKQTHISGKRSAWALQAMADYDLPVLTEYSPTVSASYTYLTGEKETDNIDGTFHGWDPMYEGQNPGNIINSLFYFTGIQAATLTGSIEPIEDLTVTANSVYAWFTSEYEKGSTIYPPSPTYSDTLIVSGESALGWETDVILTYDYTEDVQLGLTTGLFIPGAAFRPYTTPGDYSRGNDENAWEAIASMKVTF